MLRPSARCAFPAILILLGIAALACNSASFMATPVPTSTSTPAATATSAHTATPTPTPTRTPRPTFTPNATETQLVIAGDEMLEKFFIDDYITWQDSKHYHLDDTTRAWAQLGWYQMWSTGFFPGDFVIKADFSWETASKNPDLNTSGCGFVFHAEDGANHYMIFLGMDGYVHALRFLAGNYGDMGRGYAGKLTNPGQASFTLVASGNTFHTFVNDEFVKSFTGAEGRLSSGMLAYTLSSGTNKGFGTRCKMTNIHLWVPKK